MAKQLIVLVEGTDTSGRACDVKWKMTHKQLMSHMKQMLKSLAQSGIVHEIEDRNNPFSGIAINRFEVFRVEDIENDDEDEYEDEDDEDFDDENDG